MSIMRAAPKAQKNACYNKLRFNLAITPSSLRDTSPLHRGRGSEVCDVPYYAIVVEFMLWAA